MDDPTGRRPSVFINTIPYPHVRDQTLASYRATQILAQIYGRLTPRRQRKATVLFLQTIFGDAPACPVAHPEETEDSESGAGNYQLTSNTRRERRRKRHHRTTRQRSEPQILSMGLGDSQQQVPAPAPQRLHAPRLMRSPSSVFDEEPSSSEYSSSGETDGSQPPSPGRYNRAPNRCRGRAMARRTAVDTTRQYLSNVRTSAASLLGGMDILGPVSSSSGGGGGEGSWVAEWQAIAGMPQEQAEREFSDMMKVQAQKMQAAAMRMPCCEQEQEQHTVVFQPIATGSSSGWRAAPARHATSNDQQALFLLGRR